MLVSGPVKDHANALKQVRRTGQETKHQLRRPKLGFRYVCGGGVGDLHGKPEWRQSTQVSCIWFTMF